MKMEWQARTVPDVDLDLDDIYPISREAVE